MLLRRLHRPWQLLLFLKLPDSSRLQKIMPACHTAASRICTLLLHSLSSWVQGVWAECSGSPAGGIQGLPQGDSMP